MGVALVVLGKDLFEPVFHLARRLAGRDPGAVADAEDMRVDGDGRFAERDVKDDIGGLTPDAGKFFQGIAGLWNLTAVFVDKGFR